MDIREISRRQFLQSAMLSSSLVFARNSYPQNQELPVWLKVIQCAHRGRLKFLQFTDIHFFLNYQKMPLQEKRRREMTVQDMQRLIEANGPDLVIVTGDLWHDNPEGRGREFMEYSIEKCSDWGIPWVFTWGNHDQLDDYNVGHKAFSEAKGSFYAGKETEGNYVVLIQEADGKSLLELFCLNTNNEGIEATAKQFVELASKRLHNDGNKTFRLGAFHIPIRHYEDCWHSGEASGIYGETVCYEKEDGGALPFFKAHGFNAIICGHDHVNDFSGTYESVELIYGRATGHAGYGTQKVAKGAKLYLLDAEQGKLEWQSVFADGTTWQPRKGERVELL